MDTWTIDQTICQIAIMLFGCSAVWLVGRNEDWRRWGYIAGLCAQPFWLFTSWKNGQWGILLLSLWYAYSWSQGIYNHWILPRRAAEADLGQGRAPA